MREWRKTARTIAATAAVTSVVWLGVGAVVLQKYQAASEPGAAPIPAQPFVAGARPSPTPAPARGADPRALTIPVHGVPAAQLTDTFTQAREGGRRVHDAIDIMAPRGTPVLAAAAGTVEKLFLSDQGGKTVYVRSPDGTLIYYYAHLDAYAPGLAEGQVLRARQAIGTVGVTGNANPAGPHLHFAVQQTTPAAKWYEPSTALNPYPLLTRR
ncbi:MAG: M23 family metallopeptidase [Novosphingobium sp.]